MSERLSCTISAVSEEQLPDDDHPFWSEIEGLADKIAASLKVRGVAPDSISHTAGNGSQLTVSSDTPGGVLYFWIELPSEDTVRAQWLSMCLEHLTRARHTFPDGDWSVCIGEQAIAWSSGAFHDESRDGYCR